MSLQSNRAACLDQEKVTNKSDLLTHKYRPDSIEKIKCHPQEAKRLKQWILDFKSTSSGCQGKERSSIRDDDDDDDEAGSSTSETSDAIQKINRKCVLLTGPPGVGKTSLVYTVAKELNMHVVESHSAEKRDFRLFTTLKLANQKGKINPIAKMFQAAQNKQQQQVIKSNRKRRKLDELQASTDNHVQIVAQKSAQCLSLSGDSSIVLFDDIDVIFDEDGPFLKSLVEFVRDSKRPVILTATQSIDYIKTVLGHYEHIHLGKPMIEECTQVLRDICRKEHLNKLAKISNCRTIARRCNCDIRRSLNRIQFYGEFACNIQDDYSDVTNIKSDLTRLSDYLTVQDNIRDSTNRRNVSKGMDNDEDDEDTRLYLSQSSTDVLKCYSSNSLTDLMDCAFNFMDRHTLLDRWLGGKPSIKREEYDYNLDLGEEIKSSIVELTNDLYNRELINYEDLLAQEKQKSTIREAALLIGNIMNSKIKGRIEPPEVEFYTDIVPMLGETIKLEAECRWQHQKQKIALNGSDSLKWPSLNMNNGTSGDQMIISRRTRRVQSYLDSISIYLESDDYALICETLLTPTRLQDTP